MLHVTILIEIEIRELGQFRQMGKSTQIIDMNKSKIFISIFYIQIGLFQDQRSCEGWVLGRLGHFVGLWAQISEIEGRDTQEVTVSLQLTFEI